jgi:hypothetical protein
MGAVRKMHLGPSLVLSGYKLLADTADPERQLSDGEDECGLPWNYWP